MKFEKVAIGWTPAQFALLVPLHMLVVRDKIDPAKPKPASNSDPNAKLRTLVHRIERIEDEKDAMASDIRDIYAEARDHGYDTEVLRDVIRRRKKARADMEA